MAKKIIREGEDTLVLRLVDWDTDLAKQMAKDESGEADEYNFVIKFPDTSQIKNVDMKARKTSGIITTIDVDRSDEVVVPALMDVSKAKSVLYAHNYGRDGSLPIGRNLGYEKTKTNIIASTGYEFHEFAEKVWQMIASGFPFYNSVGFIPRKMVWQDDDGYDAVLAKYDIKGKPELIFLDSHLLEYSVVPVPANPNCPVSSAMKGIVLGGNSKSIIVDGLKPEEAVELGGDVTPIPEESEKETPEAPEAGQGSPESNEEIKDGLTPEPEDKDVGDNEPEKETPEPEVEIEPAGTEPLGELPETPVEEEPVEPEVPEKVEPEPPAEQKAGEVLSKVNKDRLVKGVALMNEAATLLGDVLASAEPKDDKAAEPEAPETPEEPEKKSEPEGETVGEPEKPFITITEPVAEPEAHKEIVNIEPEEFKALIKSAADSVIAKFRRDVLGKVD